MLRQVAIACAALLLIFIQDAYSQQCSEIPCGDLDTKTERQCLDFRNGDGDKPCCWDPSADKGAGACLAKRDDTKYKRSAGGAKLQEFARKHPHGFNPNPDPKGLKKLAENMKINKDDGLDEKGVNEVKRSLSGFALNPLALALGGSSLFPECPVHVKYCYRVPCGGHRRPDLENNPNACLSNPLCCYDYKTAFYKRIFGTRMLGDSPSCYYGATSKQWRSVTKSIRPWNPFLTKFILQIFKPIFNTAAFNIGGQLACSKSFGGFGKRAYPVGEKSKLDCNLVSGCWDDDAPEGSRCTMGSAFLEQIFGLQSEVYPSLYTSDPSDTKCSSNWFDYGPRAYNRLPCGVGPAPPGIFEKVYQWCPPSHCCINYATLFGSGESGGGGLSDLLLLSSLGGGGQGFGSLGGLGGLFNPTGGGSTPFDSSIFAYLTLSGTDSGSSDLGSLFCPYRFALTSDLFADLAEYAIGCCTIPECYHKKKKLIGGYVPPPRPQPPRPQPTARWGDYGPCSAACGQQGSQRRQCFYGNTPTSPQACFGSDSRTCYGPQCSYGVWGSWQQQGACSSPCGSATATFVRSCYVNGQLVQSSRCNGLNTEQRSCVNNPPCTTYEWAEPYQQMTACSVNCGTGTATYRPTRCRDSRGQNVPTNFCSEPRPSETRQCRRQPCQVTAQWSAWVSGPCGATCGARGLREETRKCEFEDGRAAPDQLCGGNSDRDKKRILPCTSPACQDQYYWLGIGCERDFSSGQCTIIARCYRRVGGGYVPGSCPERRIPGQPCASCPYAQ
uniref:uncharacterized protein LOC120337458 isoform X2 n=1 Tax=Styela clava TaxID=7725 RepID=UPI001939D53C|nr:uncharacterized protein LOC120337458 isoform X2 [Styela clava]